MLMDRTRLLVQLSELNISLTDLLGQYRSVLAFPGEPLGVTDRAVHLIRLKANTKPVYIPAYRLLHSQRTIVVNMVNNILEESVIQELP